MTVSITVVDALRVRSQPRISDDSFKYEPLLPAGTPLVVLDGPVSSSGYEWYEVAPLSQEYLPQGWVAGASRAGETWIADGDFTCPPTPTDVRSLTALPPGVGLACFPRKPITVRARLFECNCDIDGGYFEPDWFTFSSRSALLVSPEETSPPSDVDDWFPAYLDPTGEYPPTLPIGRYAGEGTSWSQPKIVDVTGVFDHPAAASCTLTAMDGEPASTKLCRLKFAVTGLAVVPR